MGMLCGCGWCDEGPNPSFLVPLSTFSNLKFYYPTILTCRSSLCVSIRLVASKYDSCFGVDELTSKCLRIEILILKSIRY